MMPTVPRLAAAFDYEILKCHEEGDSSTATVRITSIDMPGMLSLYKKYLLAYARDDPVNPRQ